MRPAKAIVTNYDPGAVREVTMHDGSTVRLRKVADDYDPTDRDVAYNYIRKKQGEGEVVTGLLYLDPLATDLHMAMNTSAKPLNALAEAELCPGASALERLNAALR